MPAERYPDWESLEIRAAGDSPVAFGADLSPGSLLGGGNGEARGVSVFSTCCVVLGGSSVPLPVCNGGA